MIEFYKKTEYEDGSFTLVEAKIHPIAIVFYGGITFLIAYLIRKVI